MFHALGTGRNGPGWDEVCHYSRDDNGMTDNGTPKPIVDVIYDNVIGNTKLRNDCNIPNIPITKYW